MSSTAQRKRVFWHSFWQGAALGVAAGCILFFVLVWLL